MKPWHSRMGSRGVSALEAAVVVSVGVVLLFPSRLPAQASPDEPEAAQWAPLLQRIQQDQEALSEGLARLANNQELAMARQTVALRQHYAALAEALRAERDGHRENFNDLARLILTISLTIGGVLLGGMAAVGWSVLRALHRLPQPQMLRPPDRAEVWSILANPALADTLDDLERRLLRMGEAAARIGPTTAGSRTPSSAPPSPTLPGDFL